MSVSSLPLSHTFFITRLLTLAIGNGPFKLAVYQKYFVREIA